MKTLLLLLTIGLYSIPGLSQTTPQKFNYQGVARNSSGVTLSNQNISIKVQILDSDSSTIVYEEIHSATTNQFGLFSLQIGGGVVNSGLFASIQWGSGRKFIRTFVDLTGGTNHQLMGTSQLLSVPYALQAGSAGNETLKSVSNRGSKADSILEYTQNNILKYSDRSLIDKGYTKRYAQKVYDKLRRNDTLKILCWGTSLTYGWNFPGGVDFGINGRETILDRAQNQYPESLDSTLKARNSKCQVINHGYPGDNSRNLLSRWVSDTSLRPDLIIIECGYNDAGNFGGNGFVPVLEYKNNMDSLVDRALKMGASVLFITSTPINHGQNRRVSYFKSLMMQIALERDIPVIDMSSVMKKHGEQFNGFTVDGLHFTGASYQTLGIQVADYILNGSGTVGIKSRFTHPQDGFSQYEFDVDLGFGLKYTQGNGITSANYSVDTLNIATRDIVQRKIDSLANIAISTQQQPITTVTNNKTLDNSYYTVLVDATSGNIVITLPTASANNGRIYIIKKIDSTTNSVSFTSAEGTQVLNTQWIGKQIQSNGSNWYITGSF